MKRKISYFALFLACIVVLSGCSSKKYLQEDEHLLSSVKVTASNKHKQSVAVCKNYVRQRANSRWFNVLKVPMGLYCMAGKDSTKRFIRFLHRMGEAPVVYDSVQTSITCNNMQQAMQAHGYLNARIDATTSQHKHKTKVTYTVTPGRLYSIGSIAYDVDDALIDSLIHQHESESLLSVGMPCNVNTLDEERSRIISMLHSCGYYKMLKRYIYYDIDTIAGPDKLALTLHFSGKTISADTLTDYTRYWIGNIRVNVGNDEDIQHAPHDSIKYRGIWIRYYGNHTIRPNVIYSQLQIQRGSYYSENDVRATYNNFSRLQMLRSSTIHFTDTGAGTLNCEVTLSTNKLNQITAELEGTNTAGDLGIASSVSFTNHNLFHGSEVWTNKIKGAFEAITGLEGYSDQNFFEFQGESRLSFPRIIIPFMPEHRRVNMHGNTELSLQYNTQDRPEFHRRFLTGLWSYKWTTNQKRCQHKLDAVGLNYVFMPWISGTFRQEYLDNDNARFAIVRYTYEDLLILNSAYNFIYASAPASSQTKKRIAWQFHAGVESAGNLLSLMAPALNFRKDAEDRYQLFHVAFAQYLKFDVDYARSIMLDQNNTLAMRGAVGLVLPYGNNTIVPFEKRYFAGGANSVRGWSVRELGPGSYAGEDGKVDFINQTGNLKLLLQMELRTYLFWKLNGALFVDAGNIWTTRNYAAQPGGMFHFDTFYKQLAASYGLGLRFNFDYFILRFDMAMKAVNPSYTTEYQHYPFTHPNLKRDFTLHFAVGLPF